MAPHANKRNCSFQQETWLHLAAMCIASLFKLLNIQVIVFSIMRVTMLIIENVLRKGICEFLCFREKAFVLFLEGDFILKNECSWGSVCPRSHRPCVSKEGMGPSYSPGR